VPSKIKKIEMAMIDTLQLAARKNLIQVSSDVINYNSNCHSGLSKDLPTTCLDYLVFPYLKNNVFKKQAWHNSRINASNYYTNNCHVPTLPRSFENMKRRE
jgi:hypothetical protein